MDYFKITSQVSNDCGIKKSFFQRLPGQESWIFLMIFPGQDFLKKEYLSRNIWQRNTDLNKIKLYTNRDFFKKSFFFVKEFLGWNLNLKKDF